MRNRQRSGRLVSILAAAVLAVAAVGMLPSAASAAKPPAGVAASDPVAPQSCPQGFTRPGDRAGRFIASGVNIRTGPGTNCTSLGQGQNGQSATYHCWVVGHDGRTWTHLTNNVTGVSGWSRDDFLSNFGSPFHC